MSRRVVISGLGPISALGVGMDATWQAVRDGTSAVTQIEAFDATGFASCIGSEVRDFRANKVVPKSYRKAVKVMARDIEIAVGCADAAARDAHLITAGTDPDAAPSYPANRMAAQIGAGLISADLAEVTEAFVQARNDQGDFSYTKWGSDGMTKLTPLWLLKYLPNMLACHVTIIHGTNAPSNTITCGEASGGLSIGEALRVIRRDHADLSFCGGAESNHNPMSYMRQLMTGRLNTSSDDNPQGAVRPLSQSAAGTVVGEGGAIVILEAYDTYKARAAQSGARAMAEVLGFAASQTVSRETRNVHPGSDGRSIASAIRQALRAADTQPQDIDLIVPYGLGEPQSDQAEAAALRTIFGDALANIPLCCPKALIGNCSAGASGIDVCVAARAIAEQTIPASVNCDDPLPGLKLGLGEATSADLKRVLVYSSSLGGQNAALVLGRLDD